MGLPTYNLTELLEAANATLRRRLPADHPALGRPGPLISERTLRTYFTRDLMPRAIGRGRGAHYDARHLDRLVVIELIRKLSPETTRLEQVREMLDQLGSGYIADMASGAMPFQLVDDGRPESRVGMLGPGGSVNPVDTRPEPSGSGGRTGDALDAADIDALVKALAGSNLRQSAGDNRAETKAKIASLMRSSRRAPHPIRGVRILEALRDRLRWHRTDGPAADEPLPHVETRPAQTWHRIRVGSDLEIHARGPLPAEHLELLHEAASEIAHLLHARTLTAAEAARRGHEHEPERHRRSAERTSAPTDD